RRRRPAPDGHLHGLHDPDRDGGADNRAWSSGDADALHAAWNEGSGRVRCRRAARRALRRDRERASRARSSPDRASPDAEPRLVGDPERRDGGAMISGEFDFHAPTNVAEALELLGQDPDGKALAGGMSLVPAMNLGIARPTRIVSLNRI